MTAKQKANQARFKKVVAEAQKLRKKNPKLTQAQAVKKAWAIIKPKKIGNLKITKYKGYTIEKDENGYKVLNPQGFDDVGEYLSSLKLAKIHIDDSIEDTIGKINKKRIKKSIAKKIHKDTKSHNVNIRVVSGTKKKILGVNKFDRIINQGINEFYVDKLKTLTDALAKAEKQKALLDSEWKKMDKNFKERNAIWKKHWPSRIKFLKKMISETKRHIK